MQQGADVNAADDKGRTALHMSSTRSDVAMVTLLLDLGATQAPDHRGNTPLHLAACTHNTDVVAELLKRGGSITARDMHGCTPMAYARSHLDVLRRSRSNDPSFRTKILQVDVDGSCNPTKEFTRIT